MIRLHFWIPLLLALLLFSCQGKKGGEVQLYELKIFLLQGSNQSRESSVPLFAGETSIRFIENVMKDRESLKEQLKNTFGYQQIELLDATGFTFLRSGKEQQFLLQLDDRYLLRLILLPNGEGSRLPLHVTLVKSSEELPLPTRGEREEWDHFFIRTGPENRLFSLRADVPLKKGIMLGKALPTDGSEALFLLLQPLENHVADLSSLKEILQTYPRQAEIYGKKAYQNFLQTVYRKLGASYPEGKTQFASPENAGSAADSLSNVVPFAELSKRPVVKKTVQPSYPEDARRQGEEGMTVVSILVDEQGRVIREKLVKSSGTASLDSAALAAARRFRFEPGEKDGRAVKVWLTVPFSFRLKKEAPSSDQPGYREIHLDPQTTVLVVRESGTVQTIFQGYIEGYRSALAAEGGRLQKVPDGLQVGEESVHYLIIENHTPRGTFFAMREGNKALFFRAPEQVYGDAGSLRRALAPRLQKLAKIQ